jgi:hypothetical protein
MTIKNQLIPVLAIICAAIAPAIQSEASEPFAMQKYDWKNIRMGGCGFVTGIIFSETTPDAVYCRTDMGGAYKRNGKTGEWEPLLDWITTPDMNLMGVESIAIDPSDPNRVYLACGTNTTYDIPDGAILRSKDGGKTFDLIRIPVKFGGNENGRGNGERMAVDPKNGEILLLGTRHNGLLVSRDGASTWARCTNFPDMMEKAPSGLDMIGKDAWMRWQGGSGIIRVIYAPASTDEKYTKTIYVAASIAGGESVFATHDGGATWEALKGQPVKGMLRPTDMDLSPDGVLYISYGTNPGPMPMKDGAVWKYDTNAGKWTDITPVRSGSVPNDEHSLFGYCSVAVDPHKAGVVMAIPFWYVGGEDIFRSLDGGATWKPIIRTCGRFDYSQIPYSETPNIHWLFDAEVDPFDSNHLIFTTGFGCMETFDLTKADKPAATPSTGNVWLPAMAGIEESVPLDMFSPKVGPQLVTAVGDYGGFIHYDLDKFSSGAFDTPRFNNTSSLGVAWQKPGIYVRVGSSTKGLTPNIAFSTDSGKTWICGTNIADGTREGSAAINADGSVTVWTPAPLRGKDWTIITKTFAPHFTTDMGKTWTPCAGLPDNIRVVADSVKPKKFYAFDVFTRTLFRSDDGAKNFVSERVFLQGGLPVTQRQRGDDRGGQDRIYLAPDREGDIWLALFDGLYHINADGKTFSRTSGVDELCAFGFGKAAPDSDYPALYLVGVVGGKRGIYRSDDCGKNFVLINDTAHQWASILLITGDMRKYGRVYVGTHGRGAIYGDISELSTGNK